MAGAFDHHLEVAIEERRRIMREQRVRRGPRPAHQHRSELHAHAQAAVLCGPHHLGADRAASDQSQSHRAPHSIAP